MPYIQNYETYYQAYFRTRKGIKVKNKAQRKWRRKLAAQYGTNERTALRLHKERLANERQRNAN